MLQECSYSPITLLTRQPKQSFKSSDQWQITPATLGTGNTKICTEQKNLSSVRSRRGIRYTAVDAKKLLKPGIKIWTQLAYSRNAFTTVPCCDKPVQTINLAKGVDHHLAHSGCLLQYLLHPTCEPSQTFMQPYHRLNQIKTKVVFFGLNNENEVSRAKTNYENIYIKYIINVFDIWRGKLYTMFFLTQIFDIWFALYPYSEVIFTFSHTISTWWSSIFLRRYKRFQNDLCCPKSWQGDMFKKRQIVFLGKCLACFSSFPKKATLWK